MVPQLHLITLNVQGLRDKLKRNRFYEWVKNQKANIILAQETHFSNEIIPYIRAEWQGEIIHSIGTSQSRGVSIFIHNSLQAEIIDTYIDLNGRFIIANVKINNSVFCITNIYAPNDKTNRNKLYKQIQSLVEEKSLGYNIIGGDWNDVQNNEDRLSKNRKTNLNSDLDKLKKSLKLIDPWRLYNKEKQQFTWKRKNSSTEASRIDFFLIQNDLIQRILKSDIRPANIKYTDHQGVSLRIDIKVVNRGPGYWKMNNSLLKDLDYQIMVNSIIYDYTLGSKKTQKMQVIYGSYVKLI